MTTLKIPVLLALLLTVGSMAPASDLSAVPAHSIAKKTRLLFADNFRSTDHDPRWHRVVDTFAFEKGALRGMQTRERDTPSADGRSVISAHPAVYGLELPTRDSVVECKIRFEGANTIDVEFDDRKYTGSHYGHLCRAQVHLDRVVLIDERDGSQSNALNDLRKDPIANRDAIRTLLAEHSASYPAKLEAHRWYRFVVETLGEEMRVTIDGKPAGYLKSAGIGHPTKSKIELGVGGRDGLFGSIKVWSAEPVARR